MSNIKNLVTKIDNIQSTINQMDADLAADRRDMQDFRLRLGQLENQMTEVLRQLHELPPKVGNEVSDAVEPVTTATTNLKKEIAKKKTIAFQNQKGWFKKLIRR
jgi:chromosome segregation ATPase